jgi:hypothetical protein
MEIRYEWYATNNPILGIKNYMPICELEVRRKDKTWMRLVFKIDSGADTTLMRESDCRDLGYSFEDCQQLEFHTASEKTIKTYVRMLDMRIAGYMIKDVPVAFSTSPINIQLLGRAKIFETLDICFFHKNKNTIFASAGL